MKHVMACVLFCFFCWQTLSAGTEACPFCDPTVISAQKVYESQYWYVLVDYKPVIEGHLLVIPKRNVLRANDLSRGEWAGLGDTIPKIVATFKKALNTDQYVILEKNGPFAGQIVPHVHFHLLPVPTKKLGDAAKAALYAKVFDHPPRRLEGKELADEVTKWRTYFRESE